MYSGDEAKFRQGAIVRAVPFYVLDEPRSGVLLTPECDLAQDKADTVLFVALFSVEEYFSEIARSEPRVLDEKGFFIANPSKSARSDILHRLAEIQLNHAPRYHWLDPLPAGGGPWVADFQFISCLGIDELSDLTPVANLADPMKSAIAARYAAYAGRIGIPDPDHGLLAKIRDELWASLFPVSELPT